jgi:hypothetical protein
MKNEPADVDVIDVHIASLGQIFDEMDPAPYEERDLNPRLEQFIVNWSRELPRRAPVNLHLRVDQASTAPDAAAVAGESIRRYFRGRGVATRLGLRRLFAHGRIALLIGLSFLAVALAVSRLLNTVGEPGGLIALIEESLVVGGWVALWRPLEVFLYDWWPIVADARLFDRLGQMPVEIIFGAPR